MLFYSKFVFGFADKIERIGPKATERVTGLTKLKVGSDTLKVVLQTDNGSHELKITPKSSKIDLAKQLLKTGISIFDPQTVAQFKKSNIKVLMAIASDIEKHESIAFPSEILKKNVVYKALFHYTARNEVARNPKMTEVQKYKLKLSDGKTINVEYNPKTKVFKISGANWKAFISKTNAIKGSVPKEILKCLNYNIVQQRSIANLDNKAVLAYDRVIIPADKRYRIKGRI